MSILGGIVDAGAGLVKAAAAPAMGAVKMGLEPFQLVGKMVSEPGKALDHLMAFPGEQMKNLTDIPKDIVGGIAQSAEGLKDTGVSAAKFIGGPIVGVGKLAVNNIQTDLKATGQFLTGDFKEAAQTKLDGVGESVNIVKDTAKNQVDSLF